MAVESRILREGLVAGLLGAVVVAAWFLVIDLIQQAPFQTPAVLWAGLVQRVPNAASVTPALGPVLGYTLLHLLAFGLFGVVAAVLLAAAEGEPAMLLALLIFFAAFEVFFLALVTFLARPLLGVLAWWEILIGNLLAAGAMLGYLAARHRSLVQQLLGREGVTVIREGLVAGLLGAAVVAIWFFSYDTLRFGKPLRTPALLGAAVFAGLRDPAELEVHLELVLAYTVLHCAVFAAFGLVVAALLVAAEREPRVLLALLILFWCFELFFLGFVSALDEALAGALLWWNVAVANLLAAVVMLTYFFMGHRSLGGRLFERWTED